MGGDEKRSGIGRRTGDEKRLGVGRRTGDDRRSGIDTRLNKEKQQVGERRSGVDPDPVWIDAQSGVALKMIDGQPRWQF
jgi:hypothetical protein